MKLSDQILDFDDEDPGKARTQKQKGGEKTVQNSAVTMGVK